ncbi:MULTISPECIES: type II toxin-antitoxin system RelB/DinJ family antitoxin [unclassified Leuconostoc]|uniref:type II toxin-antitoxin system RelB/DinJ family antitoxin n=1 Tax=Leuconostoc TaxID=1243 RepID=UPI0019047D2E|nr:MULTISPECIES: type II toxin-antitoxin system RelB/DinJ family antitoxin [unclassified Leuconostoc]MBK0040788.1 type II toxin-antitoxin system RelB/DinJ family antitoxin [Leuconostoc sp. S51]MBK0051790.1 type II toxin-antitoxin system RelB/DinJ family antitoxin [Leuconostoc sp. S50]
MSEMVKRRIQYTLDQGVAESAEYILSKAGITPATLMSMMYAQINKTGQIPVTPQARPEDIATAKLINASYNLPSVSVDNQKALDDFLEDDGGY